MRIGFIVDGDGEVEALPKLFPRIRSANVLLQQPVRGAIQPKAEADLIARAAAAACRVLGSKRVDLAVVLLDFEDRPGCPGAFAVELERLISARVSRLGLTMNVAVVVKVAKLENWLVSDLDSIQAMRGLFPNLHRITGRVTPGNADHCDAYELLQTASARRGSYRKLKGAVAICRHLDPGRAALNSRSFRRFLRVLGDSRYTDQSRLPNADA